MTPKEKEAKKSKKEQLLAELSGSASLFMNNPHYFVTRNFWGTYTVIGSGKCNFQMHHNTAPQIAEEVKNSIRSTVKGIKSVSVKADHTFNIISFRVKARR